MSITLYIIVFIFGLCVGSFLNCFVYRLETGKPFAKARSLCPKCHHKLGVLDLIPTVSFLILRRKCRYCKKKIAWQYLLVEIFTGIIFLLIFNSSTSSPQVFQISIFQFSNLGYLLVVSSLLIIIFLYDLKHYIIPDRIIFPAVGLAALYRIINYETLLSALVAGAAAAGFFFLIWFVSKGKWMGFGDVKLAFFMGLFLGFPKILVALFLAFFLGSLIGVLLIIFGKKKLKSEVPFGPFLIAGTLLAFFWGPFLIKWYISLITL